MKKQIKLMAGVLGLTGVLASCGTAPQPDTTKPVVTLVSSKASVTAAESIKLTATATDDVAVTKVEFYDGATKLGEDSSSPYEFDVALTATNNGSRSYKAKAFDAANNEGSSGVVAVTVAIASSNNLGEMPTITGKLSNYTQGAKVLKVSVGGQNPAVATGVLNADGSFSVILPTPRAADLSAFSTPTCATGTFEGGASDVKTGFAVNGIYNDATSTTAVGSLTRSTPSSTQTAVVGTKGKVALHVYADKELTFTYKDCNLNQGQSSVFIYNGTASLKAGWNVVYQEFEVLEVSTISPAFPTKTKTTIGMGASGLDWRLETGTGAPFKSPLSIQ